MNYQEALEYIHAVSWKGSVPGLSRITELMRRLGNPQLGTKYIHIVGTNGKGSTAAMLSSILTRAGYRTGLYISPFIIDFRERMQIGGEMISREELAAITEYIRPFAETMEDKPTEFEMITAIALFWFAKQGCDIVILEAGMGGEFDATNVIPAPEAAVFTNIGLDHTEYLGSTVEAIAATKAGILKPGCAAVLYPNAPSVEAVIRERCDALGVPLTVADPDDLIPLSHSLEGQRLSWRAQIIDLPLLGDHQRKNTSVVLAVVDALRTRGWEIPEEALLDGIRTVRWPGRFEVLRRDPLFILDGGHNPQCMEALLQTAEDYLAGKSLTVITGVLADKDYAAMYDRTAVLADRFFTLTPPNPRALSAEDLAAWLSRCGKPVTACKSVEEAVRAALSATPADGAVLAYGSLYLAAEIRRTAEQLTDGR
jgi:dihydrofolate synthase/folylpolyglutamate synthase